MDSAIKVGIESTIMINTLIQNLRRTPALVQKLGSESKQLSSWLRAVDEKFPTHLLSDADVKDWLEHQRTFSTTLRRIQTLLEDYYADGSAGRVPLLGTARFQMGPKQQLSGLMVELEKPVKCFSSFTKV